MTPPWRIDLAGWSREATLGDVGGFLGLFETAEQLGFDGVWFHEFRLQQEGGPYPSPLLLAAALLARTQRLRVGTQALVLPLHDPQLLAEELAQLHFQSGGRFDAGVGRGTDPQTLQALGIDPAGTRERFESSVTRLQASVPQVPLFVAGATRETLGFALERELPLLLSLEPPEGGQLAHAHDWLQGRASDALTRSTIARYVCIAPDRDGCEAILQPLWQKLQARRTHFALKRGVPPDQVPRIEPERMLREQFVVGAPEQCFDQLIRLRARTGLHHIRCVFNLDISMGRDATLSAMRLFATEVVPALRSS